MRALRALVLANLRSFLRDRLALFWTLAFPILFVILFGSIFSSSGPSTFVVGWVDEDGTPAYLESSNPVNISLYQRHGFEVLGTIQVGTSPPITPMLRQPLGNMDRRTREMDAAMAG